MFHGRRLVDACKVHGVEALVPKQYRVTALWMVEEKFPPEMNPSYQLNIAERIERICAATSRLLPRELTSRSAATAMRWCWPSTTA